MPLITASALRNTVPTLAPARAAELADDMDFILPKYKIDSPDVLHEFVSNLAEESGAFRLKVENLNYTTAERIAAVWPSRFTTEARLKDLKRLVSTSDIVRTKMYKARLQAEGTKLMAEGYVKKPQKLANLVYAGRMGNKLPTDGWDMRGGGFAMLTGRDMYQAYADYWATDIYKITEMVRTDDYWALDSAAWFFSVKKNLIQLAIDDKIMKIIKKWNGGLTNLEKRLYYYERAKLYIR